MTRVPDEQLKDSIQALCERGDAELLAREAARLRKRFQLVKAQLRAWATAEGLLQVPAR